MNNEIKKSALTRAIDKAQKLAGQTITIEGQFYSVNYKGYKIQFACNGRLNENSTPTCFYTTKIGGIPDDAQTDYFGGTFWDNLTQCFKHVERMQNN